MERSLNLQSVGNARELGGLPVGEKAIKRGLLLRTASLSNASGEDLQKLADTYAVGLVVDFRMSLEQMQSPDPAIPGARQLSLPVLEPQDTPGYDPKQMKEMANLMADRMAMLRLAAEMGMLDEGLYRTFVLSERGSFAYRSFFQALLELPENHAALWHCTDGKDRTGIAAMLLLSALGASRQTIMEDYLLTNDYNARIIAKASDSLDRYPMDAQTKRQMLFGMGAVYKEYLEAAFAAIDEEYGSVEAYLAHELGVGDAEREILREKFLVHGADSSTYHET